MSLRELAKSVHDAEAPLWEKYEALAAAAATDVERELVQHLAESQRFQLSFLELMTSPLPNRFHCFAKVAEDQVKLRQGPGPGNPLVRELRAGTPCLVIESDGFWANLQLPDGTRGWAFKDYIRCERTAAGVSSEGSAEAPMWPEPSRRGKAVVRTR